MPHEWSSVVWGTPTAAIPDACVPVDRAPPQLPDAAERLLLVDDTAQAMCGLYADEYMSDVQQCVRRRGVPASGRRVRGAGEGGECATACHGARLTLFDGDITLSWSCLCSMRRVPQRATN
jgi:hypothetical protein